MHWVTCVFSRQKAGLNAFTHLHTRHTFAVNESSVTFARSFVFENLATGIYEGIFILTHAICSRFFDVFLKY